MEVSFGSKVKTREKGKKCEFFIILELVFYYEIK